ncbi:MAG: diguanylate cyclase domain-containing protein [Gallionella sp.]
MEGTLNSSGFDPKYPGENNSLLSKLLVRYRSSAETEHEQATLRFLLTCSGVFYLWLVGHFDLIGTVTERAEVLKFWAHWWFPSLYFLYPLVHIASLVLHPPRLFSRRIILIFLDSAATTFLVSHGGLFNIFTALYFWIAIGYGFRYGPSWLAYSTIVSIAFFSLALYRIPAWDTSSIAGISMMLNLTVVSGYACHLLRRLQSTQRKLLLKATELESLATRDSLTGLANRALLMDRLAHAITLAARKESDVAVLFIDIDGMKMVNDRIGHAAGDALLIEIANKLQARLRAVDTFARIAGDEFVIILEGVADRQSVLNVADIVLEEVCSVTSIAGQAIKISASIGIAWLSSIPRVLWKPDTLLAAADEAMYAAKRSGKNRYCIAAVNVP